MIQIASNKAQSLRQLILGNFGGGVLGQIRTPWWRTGDTPKIPCSNVPKNRPILALLALNTSNGHEILQGSCVVCNEPTCTRSNLYHTPPRFCIFSASERPTGLNIAPIRTRMVSLESFDNIAQVSWRCLRSDSERFDLHGGLCSEMSEKRAKKDRRSPLSARRTSPKCPREHLKQPQGTKVRSHGPQAPRDAPSWRLSTLKKY